jgi:hypothetical protein
VKKTTPTGNPFLISTDENVKIGTVVEGKRKYDVVKIRNNNNSNFSFYIMVNWGKIVDPFHHYFHLFPRIQCFKL